VQLLRKLFPFRFLLPVFLVVAASGLWLHWYPRFQDIAWGLTEIVHITLGWFALAVWTGYQCHHLALKWGSFTEIWRIFGVLLGSVTLVAFTTGALLVLGEGQPAGWLLPSHFLSTFLLLAMLVIHPARVWTGWLRNRIGSRTEGGAD